MPFFKFRRGDAASAPPAGSAAQAQSVEDLRKRAKHRLIGASVLVLLGVLGFPLLFDTQPRPVAVDIPIEIPAKNAVKPLVVPAPAVVTAPAAHVPVPATPAEKVAAAASLSPKEEIYPSKPAPAPVVIAPPAIKKEAKPESAHEVKSEPKPEVKAVSKPEPKVESKAEVKAEVKTEVKPPVKAEAKPAPKPAAASGEGARATALLNGTTATPAPKVAAPAKPAAADETKVVAAAETKGRIAVQVGAFADAAKADETRRKLEKAGLATYFQITDSKDGKRIRVRVGPFATKAEAEKAIGKIRALDLPVAILSF